MAFFWKWSSVHKAFEDYKEKRLSSYEQLAKKISEIRTVPISSMTAMRQYKHWARLQELAQSTVSLNQQVMEHRSSPTIDQQVNDIDTSTLEGLSKGKEQKLDISSSDWKNSEGVKAVISKFKKELNEREMQLYNELLPIIFEETGQTPSIHTVTRHVRFLCLGRMPQISDTSLGALRDQSDAPSLLPYGDDDVVMDETAPTPVPAPALMSDKQPSEATWSTQLSMQLNKSIITVELGDGYVRQYHRIKLSKDKTREYFRCSRCDRLNHIPNCTKKYCPKITMRKGVIIGTDKPEHHPECKAIRQTEALAREIDRMCREEARQGHFTPRDIHAKGQQLAVEMACDMGLPLFGEDSLPKLFPKYHKVRFQYSRHHKQKKKFPIFTKLRPLPFYRSGSVDDDSVDLETVSTNEKNSEEPDIIGCISDRMESRGYSADRVLDVTVRSSSPVDVTSIASTSISQLEPTKDHTFLLSAATPPLEVYISCLLASSAPFHLTTGRDAMAVFDCTCDGFLIDDMFEIVHQMHVNVSQLDAVIFLCCTCEAGKRLKTNLESRKTPMHIDAVQFWLDRECIHAQALRRLRPEFVGITEGLNNADHNYGSCHTGCDMLLDKPATFAVRSEHAGYGLIVKRGGKFECRSCGGEEECEHVYELVQLLQGAEVDDQDYANGLSLVTFESS